MILDIFICKAGLTPTPDTGPSSNIEGNYFSYVEANGQKQGHNAVLISKFDLKGKS